MAGYRIEALADSATGLFYVEVFYPGDATVPVARTKPIYTSLEEAQRRVGETIKTTLPADAMMPVWDLTVFNNT